MNAPPAAGTTSDQYRAELYDEVWQKARDMGYGNVTDALVELERIKAAPPAAGVPIGMACKINGYWEAQLFAGHGCIDRQSLYAHPLPPADVPAGLAHRLLKAYDHGDTGAIEAAIEDIRTMLAAAPTPPASEQQHDGRIPSDSRNRMWELIDAALLGTVPDGLKRGDICNILAPLFASEQQRAVVMPKRKSWDGLRTSAENLKADAWNDCLDDFLRLNPHLAKGEGV